MPKTASPYAPRTSHSRAPLPAPEDKRAGLYVVFGGVLLLAAVLFYALRRRPPEHRRLLVELAQLPQDDPSEAVARRRDQLYARLKRDT